MTPPQERWKLPVLTALGCVLAFLVLVKVLPSSPWRAGVAGAGDSAAEAVAWAVASPANFSLPLSSFECDAAEQMFQTCVFRDLVLFQAQLLFVAPDPPPGVAPPSVELPDPMVYEIDTGSLSLKDYNVPTIVHVVTAGEVVARIRSAAAAAMGARGRPHLRVLRQPLALFHRIRSFTNWYWFLNGVSNAHHRMCSRFGACSREGVRRVALLQPVSTATQRRYQGNAQMIRPDSTPAVQGLLDCIGPLFWVDHPRLYDASIWSPTQVVLLGETHFGVGTDVVQPNTAALDDAERPVYAGANASVALARTRFLRACADLPPLPDPGAARPSVVLINRPLADGRSILGYDEVYARLQAELPPDASVSLHFPRGSMALHQQAALFAGAAVLVIPHGAATANFNFLPLDAVVLDVHALERKLAHDAGIMGSLPSPPYNLSLVSVDCSGATEPRVAASTALPAWAGLTHEQRAKLLTEQDIEVVEDEVREWVHMGIMEWMDFRSYRPDPGDLVAAVLDALDLWRAKRAARRRTGTSASAS